ncbi:Hypothetical protein PMT_2746 [Prochlorococcus marinus str. MIT 9313]|uniref:Uncharacterized protein n=1 Tax=Prochlorococcus marinus (strain MIT 9313) TaxID=74547 RepID=B9ESC5_PROMM|nr:Hypothetical protein PMT_2746 [Prochlorococcus marinus str. MIT 9313]
MAKRICKQSKKHYGSRALAMQKFFPLHNLSRVQRKIRSGRWMMEHVATMALRHHCF